jgi:hypothetical protein
MHKICLPILHKDNRGMLQSMAIPVMEFSREGYKIRKVFGKKSTAVKRNYQILIIAVMASCQKLDIILENKVI